MIEVKHLTKRYGNHTALHDLSFTIEKGQIYGFLGPNGAGKSTTMNIMTGCLAATSGEVLIGGYDIFEEAAQAKQLIGYLPEQPPLYLDRTPREFLTFVARAKQIPARQIPEQVEHVMQVTQITDVADRLIKNLSKGYKQRVGIAQAILGDPEIIILDEPTVGLDPKQIIEIRELIQTLGKDHTVILSSHILSEVQAICQTILIISKGRLVACDSPENLEQLFAGTVAVTLKVEGTRAQIAAALSEQTQLTITECSEQDGSCTLNVSATSADSDAVCKELFFACSRAQLPILQMQTYKANLEDIFIELTSSEVTVPEQPADPDEESSQEVEPS